MAKIILILTISLFSWLGWQLGDTYGLMTAYWLSFIGSLAGVFVGVLINRKYLQ
jgi:hypothetical protein